MLPNKKEINPDKKYYCSHCHQFVEEFMEVMDTKVFYEWSNKTKDYEMRKEDWASPESRIKICGVCFKESVLDDEEYESWMVLKEADGKTSEG